MFPWRSVALDFVRTFLATLILGLTGVVAAVAGDLTDGVADLAWSAGATTLIAAILAALSASLRAIQHYFADKDPS